jgi:menaquinone-dependent protoporphyrinogen oxidase
MPLYYATRDGQARRIAERIAARLAERGIDASPHDLATSPPPALAGDAAPIVVVAAVRYGRHLAAAARFLAAYARAMAAPPLVVASVNLTARKPGKDGPDSPYLGKWLARHRLRPALATAFAGRLDYRRYGWVDRQMIRLIMRLTGGPTAADTAVEFTDWDAVDRFALRIAELHRAVVGTVEHTPRTGGCDGA